MGSAGLNKRAFQRRKNKEQTSSWRLTNESHPTSGKSAVWPLDNQAELQVEKLKQKSLCQPVPLSLCLGQAETWGIAVVWSLPWDSTGLAVQLTPGPSQEVCLSFLLPTDSGILTFELLCAPQAYSYLDPFSSADQDLLTPFPTEEWDVVLVGPQQSEELLQTCFFHAPYFILVQVSQRFYW